MSQYYTFKRVKKENIRVEESVLYTTQTLISGSLGLSSYTILSGSIQGNHKTSLTEAGRHWSFLHWRFYLSGSNLVSERPSCK